MSKSSETRLGLEEGKPASEETAAAQARRGSPTQGHGRSGAPSGGVRDRKAAQDKGEMASRTEGTHLRRALKSPWVSPPPQRGGGGVAGRVAAKAKSGRTLFGADVISVQMDEDGGQCHPDSRWHHCAPCGQARFPSHHDWGATLMEARAGSSLQLAGPGWATARLSPNVLPQLCRELRLLRPHRASRGRCARQWRRCRLAFRKAT